MINQKIELHGEMSDFMAKVKQCEDASKRVADICVGVEQKGDIVTLTINKLDDKLKSLSDETRQLGKSLEEVINQNKLFCMENNGKAEKKFSEIDSKFIELNMWRNTTITGKFEEIDSYLSKLDAGLKESEANIRKLEKEKLQAVLHHTFEDKINVTLNEWDIKMDENRDNILTLEHYAEKYIPIQIQNMIMGNLENVMDDSQINRLKSHENKIHARVQEQLMDQGNFSSGTIFETILQINEQISKKLNMRIDLRKEPVLVEDSADASKNKQK